ncbi:MAG: hypothetical protein ACKV22_29645 [Bryobacteraceae bacterium]
MNLKITPEKQRVVLGRALWGPENNSPPHRIPEGQFLSGLVIESAGGRAMVREVIPFTPASEQGLSPGDVVLTPLRAPRDLESADHRRTLSLQVLRGQAEQSVELAFRSISRIIDLVVLSKRDQVPEVVTDSAE